MQVFSPLILLVLVRIPFWSHQLILWYFTISLPQTFFIPFDFYIHTYVLSSLSILLTVPWEFWGSGALVESKWCHYIMVEGDRCLKLLPASILDICNVFEHIHRLSMGIWQSSQIVTPTLLGSYFGILGDLWSQNDVITSWLKLTATSNYTPHPYLTNTKCLSTFICCPWA